jgi:hypothetical protein
MSSLAYLPSSPTLFNSGTAHPQMSSCYLLDSPRDELESIYARYAQVARLSKFAGGIGIGFSRVRSRGALIRGTNGRSNGIVPWLRTLDASVAAVNQGGRRKGAACVYLEPWHPDVEEFLELRDSTGEDARRTHNLNLAHWIPDEFMRRVQADGMWSLIDPDEVPELPDLWGEDFDRAYHDAEAAGRFVRRVRAQDLYARMMRTLAQTGNGWMTFKDAANRAGNQTAVPGNVIHLSNLCTEILEVSSDGETAVCNLGSVNLARHVTTSGMDWEALRGTVRTAVTFLDRVIDVMGLQDVLFTLGAAVRLGRGSRAVNPDRRGDLPDRAGAVGRAGPRTRPASGVRADPGGRRRAASRPLRWVTCPTAAMGGGARGGRRARAAQRSSRSPRRRRSPRSPGATSRRCRRCSSARRCRGSSCRSTVTWWPNSRVVGSGRRRSGSGSSAPTDRCRGSPSCPRTSGSCSERRGSCRSAR